MINISKFFNPDGSQPELIRELPLLPLRDIVLFPHMVTPVFVGRTKSINALSYAMVRDKRIFLVTQSDPDIIKPKLNDLYLTGTEASITQILRLPDGTVKILVEGLRRGRIRSIHDNSSEGYLSVKFIPFIEFEMEKAKTEAAVRTVAEAFHNYAKQSGTISKNLLQNLKALAEAPSNFADTIA
ncbi:MAG: LON peptidase substrate-binding domain-containing protein, partial [Desulfamplus sp.]|nr:LON peptidase substrate-binding domain-containing protein [Desulfamplus sp.]